MKSYLSLIPISAKVHKSQNRMTLLCIIFAVFLVTAVFSMADMSIRMETARLLTKHSSHALQNMLNNAMVQNYFLIAAALFVLILIAGVLMIASSMNSTIAHRTKFFGMMRCIGMSRQQIIRFVKLEALNWCKTAVPVGVALGVVITWILCAVLRFLVGEEFAKIPLFGISLIGIVSGILVGLVTVLIAASSPAKRAAKVSPVTAVSGNSEATTNANHALHTHFFKIETALGIHHAGSNKKNLILMTSSFALSIILFLSFTVVIDFVNHLMPQYSDASDINISSNHNTNSIDSALLNKLDGMDGVKHVYARRNLMDLPANVKQRNSQFAKVDLISYSSFDLDSLRKDNLLKNDSNIAKVYGNSEYVLAICGKNTPLKVGNVVKVKGQKLTIAGILKYNLFSSNGSLDEKPTLITSSKTFTRLTGISNYSLIMIQTTKNATDKNVAALRHAAGKNGTFSDMRDQRTTNTYIAFVFFVYAFLAIITLVTVLNIMNSISMSVSARRKQYGAMRAVGMDGWQITKMIVTEALTYAVSGCVVGCIFGLLISKFLYDHLITAHFSYATWTIPVVPIMMVFLFVVIVTITAAYAPAKQIRNMAITETINKL